MTAALDHQEVELLGIGAGPANLAFAAAVEELAPADLAGNTLLIEQHDNVAWQRGMLLPWTQSQVSFLKDLVTLRNPRSRFSFVNYLHTVGRLNDFVNMASFLPFRLEISDYLQWVAESLSTVRIEYGRRCQRIEGLRAADGSLAGWLVHMADGSTIAANNVVVGTGREARIPPEFKELPRERVIHSTEYSLRIAGLDPDAPHRIVVVGAAQSAAEMLWATHQAMPHSQCAMIIRSVGLEYYQTSKFTNELYFPSFTDEFYTAPADARRQILHDMRQTNYAGVTPGMLDTLYRQMYLERLTGTKRLRMITMVDITEARMDGDEVVLTLSNRMGREIEQLRCDLVLLGTGFEPAAPPFIRQLADVAGVAEIAVSRAYRMLTPPNVTAGCYLQGTNEDSHGIADSLMSVLAIRAGEIVEDVLAHRAQPTLLSSVPTPASVAASA